MPYGKLAKTQLECWDNANQKWVTQSFGVQLTESGRWIGRTEAFYNRRVVLSPEAIAPGYEVIRLGGNAEEYLLFANQPNTFNNTTYMYDYTALNVEASPGSLQGLVDTGGSTLSNIPKTLEPQVIGTYPVAMERFSSDVSAVDRGTEYSEVHCYIPTYSQADESHQLLVDGVTYKIRESFLELNLLHLVLLKQ